MKFKILYIGSTLIGSTSAQRLGALGRLGHLVDIVNTDDLQTFSSKLESWLSYRSGYRFIQHQILRRLRQELTRVQILPHVIWINSGELFGPMILQWMRAKYKCPIILYCNDDPTGPRDWNRFFSLRAALPLYDICVCVRCINVPEWISLGARRVLRVWMSYDEQSHYISPSSFCDIRELLFIGTNIPGENRDRFLMGLTMKKIPLSIYGGRWQKSRHWGTLRGFWRQENITDSDYSARISQSSFVLGLLSHRNRDLHTQRSMEVPAASGVLMGECTSDHQLLYENGVEAFFWNDLEECAQRTSSLFKGSNGLVDLRECAHVRAGEMGVGNEDIIRYILNSLQKSQF